MSNPFWSADQVKRIFMEHEGCVEYAFAHCKTCGANSRELRRTHSPWGGTPPISDAEVEATFGMEGWVFLEDGTARCPTCQSVVEEGGVASDAAERE